MQNFTFGRKGTNWFLFAFVLLIGTLPSFGQECPTTDGTESSQSFCYLETVGDIVTDGNAIYQTADNVNDTQPIPEDELLATGTTTYYAGSTSGNCSRIAIEVTVETNPRPILLLTEERSPGFEFTTCASEDFDSEDLATLFEADEDFTIEVYDSEFGQDPYNGVLQPGGSYFVGQVQDGECPSLRTAVGFNPNNIEGPNAASAQTFCEGATVADLEASGTYSNTQALRWYRSQNGTSPLASSTELIDGQTYYVGQVVNNRESITPPCETPSEDRTAVTVTLEEPTENSPVFIEVCTTQILPNPTAADFEGFYRGLLGNVEGGSFSPDFETLVDQYETNPIGTFSTTYTSTENCESTEVTVEITDTEEANAGSFDDITLECNAETLFDLTQLENNDQDYTEGGTFSGEGVENNQFDTTIAPGEYEVTYTVDDSLDCVSGNDSTSFTITVTGDSQTLEPIYVNLCEDQTVDNPSPGEVREYLLAQVAQNTNLPLTGSFNPTAAEVRQEYLNNNGIGIFETTYTVESAECGSTSVNIITEVSELSPANAGSYEDFTLSCDSNEVVNLYDLVNLDDNANLDGTFSGEGVENNEFNAEEVGAGTYTITYSVDDSAFCVIEGTSDSTTFEITVEGSVVGEANRTLCVSEAEDLLENPGEALNLFNELLAEVGDVEEGGEFSPGLDVIGVQIFEYLNNPTGSERTFDAVYTFGDENCQSSIDLSLTIIADQEANAGSFDDISLGCNVNPLFDLTELQNNDPNYTEGGTFSGTGVENNQFDTTIGPGEYEITYSVDESLDCVSGEDATSFTITITGDSQNLDPIYVNLCEDQTVDNPTTGEVREFLLAQVAQRSLNLRGTFEPTADQIRQQYNANDGIGIFETTYTFESEACGTTSIDIIIEISELSEANAGEFEDVVIECDAELTLDLSSLDNLDNTASEGGIFSGEGVENNIFNVSSVGAGSYTITYSVDDSAFCVIDGTSDSTTFTITVNDGGPANAGDDFSTTFCSNDEDQNLFTFLSEDANLNGYFEGFEDGVFSPSELGAGVYNFNYIVNEESSCVEGEDTAEFSIEVFEAPNAGQDISESLCITEAEEMITNPQAAIDWFNNLIDVDGVDQDGTFNPALETLAAQIFAYVNAPDTPNATFEATYSVENENCQDSATISLTITDVQEADAGEFEDYVFCSTVQEVNLTSEVTGIPGGVFTIEDEVIENGVFSPQMMGVGNYTITYTVNEDVACVTGEDSTTFEISVIQGYNLGEDRNVEICYNEVIVEPTVADVRNFFRNLIGPNSGSGNFSPTMAEITEAFYENPFSTFTTVYTVGEGDCADSVELSVTIVEPVEADAGEIESITVCSSDADINLNELEGVNGNGYFDGYENGVFSPSLEGAGTFEISYIVNESTGCVTGEATATFTIEVLQGADAGEDMTYDVCTNSGIQDLYSLISADADMDGEFTLDGEVIANGSMDPSQFETGTYTVVYSVTADDDQCGGTATSTLTITVNEVPDAPEADATFFACESDMATAAWLEAEGTDLMWYSDADLTMMVSEEDMLESGSYYVTQTLNGCESEAAEVVVTINVVPAPTASTTSFEFCDRDAATLADLTDAISFEGTLIWYDSADGDNSLGTSTRLQNGTYYASQDDGECESLDRLAITVSVENCPIIYPEGISPNGDGINDTFIVENLENEYPNYSIEIFNRWGNTIYKGNASTPAWDGTSNQSGALGDDVLPIGVYFYVIDYGDGSTAPRQGKVYLSR